MRPLLILFLSGFVFAGMPSAAVGSSAPAFSLQDQNGNTVNLADLKDKVVVLEWTNPDCPFVVRHYKQGTMKALAEKYQGEVVWLAINSTHYSNPEANKAWAESKKLNYAILDDHEGKVGKMYGAQTTPHMYVINKGVLVYVGAIDDDPRGNGSQINYVDQALTEIKAGKAVSAPQNKPYGCSVKYGS
ncbi:MAG: thioredoxin family protein [Acidobacteria bacterium]|nr:thioredoxin family protein [Acidobacteriota bacterium]